MPIAINRVALIRRVISIVVVNVGAILKSPNRVVRVCCLKLPSDLRKLCGLRPLRSPKLPLNPVTFAYRHGRKTVTKMYYRVIATE